MKIVRVARNVQMKRKIDYRVLRAEKLLIALKFEVLSAIGNYKDKLKIRCEGGHISKIDSYNIELRIKKNKKICKYCEKDEKLEELKKLAIAKGGKLLSEEYSSRNLLWSCGVEEHPPWRARASHIKEGNWCRKCSAKSLSERFLNKSKHSIETLKELAKSRGGELLSEEYVGLKKKYQWKCYLGHKWDALAINVINGTWCRYCSSGLYEEICRSHFEQIFKTKFTKSYPSWLKNKGARLELDGYCEELSIAFEHHGEQHYKKSNFFHKSKITFEKRKELDKLKLHLCNQNSVNLIIIPQLVSLTKIRDLQNFIINKCQEMNISLPEKIDAIDWSKCYINTDHKKFIELCKLAESRDGKLLSERYLGSTTPLQWFCNKHKRDWWSTVASVKNHNSWCPDCKLDKQRKRSRIQEIETTFNVQCISTQSPNFEYKDGHQKLTWKCNSPRNHAVIEISWQKIMSRAQKRRQAYVCKKCHREAKLAKFCKEVNAKCLSLEDSVFDYTNVNTKVRLKCEVPSHPVIESSPSNIRTRGYLCKKCKIVDKSCLSKSIG